MLPIEIICALQRSFSSGCLEHSRGAASGHAPGGAANLERLELCPGLEVVSAACLTRAYARRLTKNGGKYLILGSPAHQAAAGILPELGLRADKSLPYPEASCPPCGEHDHHTESPAYLHYAEHPLTADLSLGMRRRPFARFDFADEWNNMGYGRIRADSSIWGIAGGITVNGATELAAIRIAESARGGDSSSARQDGSLSASAPPAVAEHKPAVAPGLYAGCYLALLDTPQASILWCARLSGPLDSVEWSIVERFISDWRADYLPCFPCLLQTPHGCAALATMRLDCDEDISSARSLFEWYASEHIPFSLAVKTGLPMSAADISLLREVRAAGGTLLSHSHTHPVNWGRNKEEALREIRASQQWFRDNLVSATDAPHGGPKNDVDLPLAVSPFHTNPPYAVQALEEAGVPGMVSGIIHNDPEYMIGRAGIVPYTGGRLVSISQQSMLHGDCCRRQGHSVAVHVEAFRAQYAAQGIFGWLDHPFSERYQYGWDSEAQRLAAHKELTAAIRAFPGVWFWSQELCFAFVRALASISLSVDRNGRILASGLPSSGSWRPAYRCQGEQFVL